MRQLSVLVCAILLLTCVACSSAGASAVSGDSLPPGDATRGVSLFTESISGAPSCSTCHTLDGSTLVGPSLKGFGAVAATRVQGMAGADYARNSILQPASYVVSGFPNLMYGQFAQQLTPQQIADLIAYILTL